MASTFDRRVRELGELVGSGTIEGKVEVDQIYALAIHSGYWRSGPLAGVTNRPRHGGETHFLTNGLTKNQGRFMQNLADAVLEGEAEAAMAENMETLARYVFDHAPRDKQVLRNSGHPIVTVGDRIAYDRPPVVARLSPDDLRRREQFVPRRHFGGGR